MSIVQQTIFRQELVQSIPYVSTDLRMTELTAPEAVRQNMMIEGVWYRRLDAQYFVWIEQRVELARKAAQLGKISGAALDSLLTRFQDVKKWIDENLSPENLKAARRLADNRSYDPPPAALPQPERAADRGNDKKNKVATNPKKPESHLYPAEGFWEHTVPIDPDVVKLIDSIRDEAISKGWSEASLYQNRGHFIAGKWYGLICILDKTDQIERIEEDIIYIRTFKGAAIPPEGEIVKFPNLEYEERHVSR